jgi:type 1 glutamine amidotransferase
VPGLTVDVHDLGELPDLVPGDVDALVVFSDGGPDHPLLKGDHLGDIDALVDSGVGLGLMHYAVDLPAGHGEAEVKRWIGGVYVTGLSCNPIWDASFERLPEHPVTRGVRPFTMNDEWYFNIQFAEVEQSSGHQAILVATPSDEVRGGPYVYPSGPYDHIVAASGRAETVMWTLDRAGGGRSFGLTGGHFHANWGNENFRRLVLNALVWVTGAEVPNGGIGSSVSQGGLEMDLDAKPRS